MSHNDDVETSRRDYKAPYTSKHPVPTVQEYKSFKEKQKANLSTNSTADSSAHEQSERHGIAKGDDAIEANASQSSASKQNESSNQNPMPGEVQQEDKEDTSQVQSGSQNPRQRRKAMKRRDPDRAEREVTDPVTHLPVTIRDFTDSDLDNSSKYHEDNEETTLRQQLKKFQETLGLDPSQSGGSELELDLEHRGMERTFPAPGLQNIRHDMMKRFSNALRILTLGITLLYGVVLSFVVDSSGISMKKVLLFLVGALAVYAPTEGLCYWIQQGEKATWDDEIWAAQRRHDRKMMRASRPESTKWLNRILGSIWPLINPDLFASLVDMLEDVMQASLPRLVRMVSVDDLGQGSEPLRILGIKWLPRGAAAEAVSINGKAAENKDNGAEKEDDQQGNHGTNQDGTNDKAAQGEGSNISAGLEAEEGEFANVEVAFAYRSNSKKRLRDREKNAHLYMAFYLPGGIKFPVWVELQGLVGTLRARLQLTPDPPFIALCTLTFLGQPKVNLSCVPLVKRGLNLMDLPVISNFVQSAVDAAMSEYVAPKSLTLDLKSMLSGDDFKHDTTGRGVLIVRIKRAYDFKAGDSSIPFMKEASSDGYVSVGWAKFGKPMFSTRVIIADMQPSWQEETYLVVSHEELDADESLRLQLWDSDRLTADDDLGRIELSLKEIMKDEKSKGKMWERTDTFEALRAGETMPGRLDWSVGYYSKVRLMDSQVAHKPPESSITTVEQLKQYSFDKSTKKLREANQDESSEIEQLKTQDFDELSTEMISTSLPTQNYPSGILSVQIHQITGLEMETLNRQRDQDGGETEDGEEEGGEGLPDSYCTITINHQKTFKTRTKPKNSKPFFNAGTERFVRDWRNTSIYVAVRDARIHENNPLLGIVYLQLGSELRRRGASRFNGFFPLTGGIGYGRIRLSIVFRSVQLQPIPQQLGWEWGTLEISSKVKYSEDLPKELRGYRIKFRTPLAKGRMYPQHTSTPEGESQDQSTVWSARKDLPLRLPVRNRYSVPLIVEFRTKSLLKDSTPAFAVLWLQNITDEEDLTLDIPVFKGGVGRAENNVLSPDEMGEKLGSLKVSLRFWRGLGKWHARLASRNESVSEMMEVLQCATDNGLIDSFVGDNEWLARRDGSDAGEPNVGDSDSDSSSDDEDDGKEKTKGSSDDKGTGGIINEIKGYKKHKGQLHERHRGLMQWKAPRILDNLKGKAEHAVGRLSSTFEHTDRVPDMETEI